MVGVCGGICDWVLVDVVVGVYCYGLILVVRFFYEVMEIVYWGGIKIDFDLDIVFRLRSCGMLWIYV